MNSNYNYDDLDDETVHDLEKADMYWKGRDDGRLEAGGGFYTLLGGVFIGAVIVSILWIMVTVWSQS
jgi:hypothetical protein